MSLKIHRLSADNYKRLRAVEITPDGNVVVIAGRNAQGKTSVLDAIWAALAGGEASRATQQPIRDGQDTAVVKLDLGEYIVTRRWTKNDSGTLTIEAPDGARYSSPQKLLDEVIGARAFDPLAFTRLSARDQKAALLATVDLPFDPDELERERKGVFERRTDVNRDVAKLEGQIAGYPLPDPSLPADEVSAADLLEEVQTAQEINARRQRHQDEIDYADSRILDFEEQLSLWRDADSRILDFEEQLSLWRERRQKYVDGLALLGPEIDVSDTKERLASLEQTNARIRQEQQRKAVAGELSDRKNDAAALTIKLRSIEKQKADALAKVQFPVDGLGFDENGVTYKGVPFSQASSAEQLRVSVALAMAANPTLRVLRILDGSLLDADSMRLIEEMAADHDYQVFCEVVGDNGGVGIVIEDGAVAAVDGVKVA
ncbi:AAA family ATPase [Humibacter ginsenosidimutans]|uniref:AAA family ATPase n=1 Tax=Humibacter ginsenosidimutans TaxID=2599293 RepID=A0A5B8M8P2_9MICO|nr:AAA family ATPase [Humibacter ginsenosidimutans]QDZ15810.1 AAA family ATPase [Humibacter ginsenosidimutans]